MGEILSDANTQRWLFANTKLAENAVQNVIGVNHAENHPQLIQCLTQIDCDQFVSGIDLSCCRLSPIESPNDAFECFLTTGSSHPEPLASAKGGRTKMMPNRLFELIESRFGQDADPHHLELGKGIWSGLRNDFVDGARVGSEIGFGHETNAR
jgi:hypothetical protein